MIILKNKLFSPFIYPLLLLTMDIPTQPTTLSIDSINHLMKLSDNDLKFAALTHEAKRMIGLVDDFLLKSLYDRPVVPTLDSYYPDTLTVPSHITGIDSRHNNYPVPRNNRLLLITLHMYYKKHYGAEVVELNQFEYTLTFNLNKITTQPVRAAAVVAATPPQVGLGI
jgi:hypothetical protein